ncbi:hypothetical protein Mgra_00006270 [Meloidogyne graminicola]|uniref:Uncharacterized protein n=1 Tax=Meloidogyne graminicola TaxID=189291 RepID=A0A8S9ZLL9_9BILA|nr:hypothetical protein Mgra_00006270 [Meloidogyne graminicola]
MINNIIIILKTSFNVEYPEFIAEIIKVKGIFNEFVGNVGSPKDKRRREGVNILCAKRTGTIIHSILRRSPAFKLIGFSSPNCLVIILKNI